MLAHAYYHNTQEMGFKVIFWCFKSSGMFRSYCHRITGICWYHITLSVVDFILMLAFRHLGLG